MGSFTSKQIAKYSNNEEEKTSESQSQMQGETNQLHQYPSIDYLMKNHEKSQLIAHLSKYFKGIPSDKIILPKHAKKLRFIHISDTHTIHKKIGLPDGDVLIHTGDLVGNYGPDSKLQLHLKDILDWFTMLTKEKFELIIFIAGNHDTLLDSKNYNTQFAQDLINKLPANVIYLENEEYTYKGIRIFGSPVCPCRRERFQQAYYSDAFERKHSIRKQLWDSIPEGVDILMTHVPPAGFLSSKETSCGLLSKRLSQMKKPPKFHCFGHDHPYYGMVYGKVGNNEITFLNASQLMLEKHNPVALTFDMMLK